MPDIVLLLGEQTRFVECTLAEAVSSNANKQAGDMQNVHRDFSRQPASEFR